MSPKEYTTSKHEISNGVNGDSDPSQSPTAESSDFNELDYDTIDYSTALRRELQRNQTSQRLMKLNADVYQRSQNVLTGFVNETMHLEGISNNDVVFDVLPSFEMYRALQYASADEPRYHGLPPDYATNTDDNISTDTSSPVYYDFVSPHGLSARESSGTSSTPSASFTDLVTSSSSASMPESVLGADPFDKNTLENINKLPRLNSTDVQVQLYVTKDVPTPYSKCEPESMLKEYTSGDVVHGYVTITNNTNKRIPFYLFNVTLEGTVSIIDVKGKKQILKTFLNMMDLSASWSFGCVSPSANMTYIPGSQDYDGAYLGLKNDRILEPMSSYKKFFTFKFPYNSLDNICRHQQELHTLLPPSLGVNRIRGKGKYANIEVNPILGYGHNSKRGSPILTRDLSNDTISVNYSINAVLVGLNPSVQKSRNMVCLADNEYALRFIPFGFGVSLFSSQRSLNTLKKLVEHTFQTAERSLKLTLEGNEHEIEELDRQLKLEQLRLNPNTAADDQTTYNFPLRNQVHASSDFSKVETGLTYVSDKSRGGLLSKFKQSSNYDGNNNGFISITTNMPKDGLPYISPSLIKKTNELSKLNNLGIANYNLMDSSLSKNEKRKLTSIDITLKFSPSDHRDDGSLIEPPKIKNIDARLMVMNVYSSTSIPIKLSSDIFLDQKHDLFKKLTSAFEKYDAEFEKILAKFETYGLDVKKYIPAEISQDIKAMKDLKCDTYLLPVFEHSVEGATSWIKSKDTTSDISSSEWVQKLQLNLDFKEQIQETLVPTFQSCLLSRIYCIQVELSFKGGQSASLRVPIRLRQFDGN